MKAAEPEYIFIQDGESEEDMEPLAKKYKTSRGEVRYRAIKPKPSNSVDLYKCTTCNFVTMQSDLLACHRLVCCSLAYKCTMCDKKFDSQKMVLNHKIEAHLTKWICHFCNINFNDEKKFTMHMKNHLGDRLADKTVKKSDDIKKEKTLVVFQCPHCPENFEAFSQLQIHLVNHTSSVTFKCVRCDIGFESKRKLINHVKTHEDTNAADEYIVPDSPKEVQVNDTIYSCPICSLNFLQEEVYLRHLSMHPEFSLTEESNQDLNLFEEDGQENGLKREEESCLCGEETCSKCGDKKKEDNVQTEHEGDRSPSTREDGKGKEPFFQQNAGEEGSHLELNHLLYVNSLSVPLSEGNVNLKNSPDEKNPVKKQTEIETNNKSVEDILEKMFQVKDEDDMKKGPDGNGNPETEQQKSNIKHNKGKTYVCADCSFSTQELADLKQHFVDRHQGIKCWLCNRFFGTEELKKHLASEHGTNSNPQTKCYTCVHCSEKFINRRALHIHEVTHPENLRIECPDCGEKFARDKFLNEHRDEAHVVSHCRMCNKAFGSVKQLKSHEARHVRGDKNQFKCPGCDKVFQTPTGLRHHKAIHTGEFKYKCEFCDKGFVSRVRCEEHRASHTKEERYSCEICGKKFSFQATYWIHRKWHDNPTPYKCEYCGRLFKHSSLLSVHKRKHTGERPYECPHCDQAFTVGNTLKRHLMLHTGVFPFKCQICDQGFSGKHKLAQHMSKAHQDNTLLEQQAQKKQTEYKMVVKPDEPRVVRTDPLSNQTWVLTEDESQGSQLLTIQTEEGENIPCTLLTDEMIGDMVNVNNRIVEIIPYDSIKSENEDKDDESSFIRLHESDGTVLGMAEDEFVAKAEKTDCDVAVDIDGPYDGVKAKASPRKGDRANESLPEHFSTGL